MVMCVCVSVCEVCLSTYLCAPASELHMYVCLCACMCVCVCVSWSCVWRSVRSSCWRRSWCTIRWADSASESESRLITANRTHCSSPRRYTHTHTHTQYTRTLYIHTHTHTHNIHAPHTYTHTHTTSLHQHT